MIKKILYYLLTGLGLLVAAYLLLLPVRYFKYRSGPVDVTVDLPKLLAFTGQASLRSGDTLGIHVHATSAYRGEIFRYPQLDSTIATISGEAIRQSNTYNTYYGHDWPVTHRVNTKGWAPGYYFARLTSLSDSTAFFNLPIVVGTTQPAEVVVVAPTNTWQAYNTYGGHSNYTDRITPADLSALFKLFNRAGMPGLAPYVQLPQHRPYAHPITRQRLARETKSLRGKIGSDLYLARFLEAVQLPYNLLGDDAFSRGIGLDKVKLVIFHNHSEYWSYEGIGLLKQLLARGVNVIFLSGNNMYRAVEWLPGRTMMVTEQQMKRSTVEPILGTFYSESGYGEALAPYRIVDPSHWLLTGAGLESGSYLGGPEASGIETDKLGPYSSGFQLLAVGENAAGPAHLVVKDFAEGNFLLNFSSISSVYGLEDPAMQQVLLRAVDRAFSVE